MPIRIEIEFDPSKGETLADYVAALQVFGEIGEAPWAPPRARRAQVAEPEADPRPGGDAIGEGPGHDTGGMSSAASVTTVVADGASGYSTQAVAEVGVEKVENGAVVSVTPLAQRVPGHPSPGRKKRTSAEVAEDEAYFAERGKVAAAPEPPPVAPEAQAQDAADEAGTGEQKAGGLTLDDLRKAVGKYATRFGLPAAVKDIPAMLGCPVAQVPPEGVAAAIEIVMAAVEGPSPLAAAHAAGSTFVPGPGGLELNAALDSAPTAPVNGAAAKAAGAALAAADHAARVWTQDDFLAAVTDYAARFDGDGVKLAETKFARFDAPEVLKRTFGPAVSNLKTVPNDSASWEKATVAMRAAIDANPFKRAVVS